MRTKRTDARVFSTCTKEHPRTFGWQSAELESMHALHETPVLEGGTVILDVKDAKPTSRLPHPCCQGQPEGHIGDAGREFRNGRSARLAQRSRKEPDNGRKGSGKAPAGRAARRTQFLSDSKSSPRRAPSLCRTLQKRCSPFLSELEERIKNMIFVYSIAVAFHRASPD